MLWGHRNDPVNFHRCLQDFDRRLPDLLDALRPGDLLIVTSDHRAAAGCAKSQRKKYKEYVR